MDNYKVEQNTETNEKDIEVVTGDGSELDFSPVYEHLNVLKPKPKNEGEKKKQIIIPEVKPKKEKN